MGLAYKNGFSKVTSDDFVFVEQYHSNSLLSNITLSHMTIYYFFLLKSKQIVDELIQHFLKFIKERIFMRGVHVADRLTLHLG